MRLLFGTKAYVGLREDYIGYCTSDMAHQKASIKHCDTCCCDFKSEINPPVFLVTWLMREDYTKAQDLGFCPSFSL